MKPFFTATLPLPPSVNGYWGHGNKKTYLSDKAKMFRADVFEIITAMGRIKTFTGRVRAEVTIHPRDRKKCDIDNYMKGLLDALTHAKVYEDDEQIDQLNITRGHIKKGGLTVVKLYEVQA